jgi:hypothetical protein
LIIYVNDVKHNILSSIKLFADDTALIKEINNSVNDFRELNNDLETQNSWSKQWFITFNADKTKYLILSIKPNKFTHPSLILTGTQIPDPPFSSFGPSRDYGMDLCLEVYI